MEKNSGLLNKSEEWIHANRHLLLALATGIFTALPFLLRDRYLLTVIVKIGAYVILGLGLNILTGYTGLVSLGHAGFVTIGAYTASILMTRLQVNFFLALVAGMSVAGMVGVLLGLPTLRVSGTYLSIITLGFGEIVKMIAMNRTSVTNGTLGIKNIPKPSLFGYTFTISNYGLYFLMLVFVILASLFCHALYQSRTGRALRAVKADELAAKMMGIDITRFKILAFSLSAVVCAMGGILYATLISYIDPNTFNFDVSTMMLSIVILGGMGTIRGMFAGAAILIAFPEMSRFLMEYRFVLYGVILVVMMRFCPQGLLGWKSGLPFAISGNVRQRVREMDEEGQIRVRKAGGV